MAAKRSRARTRTKARSADAESLPLFASAMRKGRRSRVSTSSRELAHICTGLTSLDRVMGGGFPVAAASLIAARHRAGATSLLIGAALAALKRGQAVAYFSERLREDQIRGRFVVLESRVNGHRIRAGFMTAEDRVALAAARERIPWNLLTITSAGKLSPRRIDANIFTYRPTLVLADVKPHGPKAARAQSAEAEVLEGIASLAAIARQHDIALVMRLILPKANHPPDVLELPGLGAAVEPFAAAVLLHREGLADESDDQATGTSQAEARVVRLLGRQIEPRVVPLRFDQRFAGLLDG